MTKKLRFDLLNSKVFSLLQILETLSNEERISCSSRVDFFFFFYKKIFLFIACFIFCQISFSQVAQNDPSDYKNTPLEKVLNEWSKSYDITFSYDYDLIKNQKVSQNFTRLSLEQKLIKLLRETPLEFKIIAEKSIILKKRSPDFYDKYKIEICGQVQESNSRNPLPFVNIILENTGIGTTTDEQGNFKIKIPFVKNDVLIFRFLGYESRSLSLKIFDKQPCSVVLLEEMINEMAEVIIIDSSLKTATPVLFSLPKNSNATTFRLPEIGDIGGLVENDVMQTLQFIPGINGSDESASQLHIRGGASGQNLLLFDNIPLYHFGHFFGKVGAINPNIVEEVSVSKEGYSARYGGRVSGVIDVSGKETIPNGTNYKLEVNLLSGNASFELPILKKKAALFVAYRRSFSDFWGSRPHDNLFDQIFQNSQLTENKSAIKTGDLDSLTTLIPTSDYSDFNSKFLWQPNAQNLLSVSYLHLKDNMVYRLDEDSYYYESDDLNVENKGLNVKWKHDWQSSSSTIASFSWSKYDNQFLFINNLDRDSATNIRDNYNQLADYSFQLTNTLKGEQQNLIFGYHFTKINEAANTFKRDVGGEDLFYKDDTSGITHALFLDYHFNHFKKINFNFGSRFTYYNLTEKFYFEPRFAIKFRPIKPLTFRVAGGIYFQAINQVVEANKLNVEDHLWLLSRKSEEDDSAFPIVKNQQFSIGASFQKNGWMLDFGAYQKQFKGITSSTLRFDTRYFPFITGNMSTSGLEMNLQKKGKWFYTLASYSRSNVKYEFEHPEYEVSASYNRLHTFRLLQGFTVKNFGISASLKLASGRPYTPFSHRGEDLSDPENPDYWIEYGVYNGKLLSSYQRLDISFSWKFVAKKVSGKITLAALNVFNRENSLQRFYSYNFINGYKQPPILVENDRLGLPFTPNLGVMLEFGK